MLRAHPEATARDCRSGAKGPLKALVSALDCQGSLRRGSGLVPSHSRCHEDDQGGADKSKFRGIEHGYLTNAAGMDGVIEKVRPNFGRNPLSALST